jgi:hypothetical protein
MVPMDEKRSSSWWSHVSEEPRHASPFEAAPPSRSENFERTAQRRPTLIRNQQFSGSIPLVGAAIAAFGLRRERRLA